MPLEVLLPIVVFGIGAIIFLVHVLGFSRECPLPDSASVRRHWLRHFPEDHVSSVVIDDDGHTAFVDTQEGPGILWSFGADTVARRLHGAEIEEIDQGFRVHFHDFTAPKHTVRLNPDHHEEWSDRLMRATA